MEKVPAGQKSDLHYEAQFGPTLSRLFIFRAFYLVVEIWVIYIWAIWFSIISFVHFWYMLILGSRSEALFKKQLRFYRHMAKWGSYLNALTDKRPEWIEE